ncbi:MAG TPA: hypothetical protein VFI41_05310 [Gemmatimonadales bacterium]|nr:hypothetical protein [Gemmatimonadales bacterium]
MTRRILGTLAVAALLLGPAAPAYARGYRDGDCNREGNCNDQSRHSGRDDNHKAFSPDLKDSPTTLYFCLPGSTCNFGDSKDKDGQDGDQGQEPSAQAAEPNPACIIAVPYHCDPKP